MAFEDPIWSTSPKRVVVPLRKAQGYIPGLENKPEPLPIRPAAFPDPTTIPPRQWLYGTHVLRGFVTVLVAPGAVGKSSLAYAIALALASGKAILKDHIHQRVDVAMFPLEDPEDETDRRMIACMMRHKIDETELRGRVHVMHGEDHRLLIATKEVDGYTIAYPDEEALTAKIAELGVGLLIVDPFVNCHDLDENSPAEMNSVARAWLRIARATNCAIILVHHTRKGAQSGDIDGGRGAKSLTDAARVGLTLAAMTEDEAKEFGIRPDDRRQYVRLDNAKANLSPACTASWFRLESVALGNGTPDYPNGDHVQAIVRWEPPTLWAKVTVPEIHEVLDIIAAGMPDGRLYTPTRAGRSSHRWVGNVLMDQFSVDETQAKAMLFQWFKSGLLEKVTTQDPTTRKDVTGVAVDNSKRPE